MIQSNPFKSRVAIACLAVGFLSHTSILRAATSDAEFVNRVQIVARTLYPSKPAGRLTDAEKFNIAGTVYPGSTHAAKLALLPKITDLLLSAPRAPVSADLNSDELAVEQLTRLYPGDGSKTLTSATDADGIAASFAASLDASYTAPIAAVGLGDMAWCCVIDALGLIKTDATAKAAAVTAAAALPDGTPTEKSAAALGEVAKRVLDASGADPAEKAATAASLGAAIDAGAKITALKALIAKSLA